MARTCKTWKVELAEGTVSNQNDCGEGKSMGYMGQHDSTRAPRRGVVCVSGGLTAFPLDGGGRMRFRGKLCVSVAAMLVLAAISACTSDPDEAPSTTASPAPSASTSTPPSASPSPSPTSESEAAATSAERLVRDYYGVLDELGQDPSQPLTRLEEYAESVELTSQQRLYESERSDGLHQTGDTRIADLVVQGANLSADPQTVEVDVCFDVAAVDIVDANGATVVTPDRPEVGWIRHTVVSRDGDSDPTSGWRVSSSQDLEEPPCDAT
ncbi:hypothetical protein [Georgenia yuyongxinii]|uniref:Uncharacterized protein n=1 Tax=Georgenia yuyongxinii TaxID=2589797 RepID=A0A552WX83_9MICO|nr:hypothetical protein [Georgenia yuyongxinii]TRW47448.1 hypothetical protein FJ693_01210 [Georgenia yuyongxinii]